MPMLVIDYFDGYDIILLYGRGDTVVPKTALYKMTEKKPIHYDVMENAYEWCDENNIDPSNMSEEDIMAFKLRFL